MFWSIFLVTLHLRDVSYKEREDISLQSGPRDLSKSYANEIKKDEWSCLVNQNMNDGTNTQV